MSQTKHYDLVVIGAGQSGVPLAGAFATAGRSVAIVERSEVGGTCINWGCTPTKTMVASAQAAHVVARADEYGLRSTKSAVDMTAIRERKRRMVQMFRTGSEQKLQEQQNLHLYRGHARFTGLRCVRVLLSGEQEAILTADLVLIDTGQRPHIPAIVGLDQVPWLDSTSIMELDHVPPHLLVLGGGYVGLEFAQLFRRLGSDVTIIQRRDQLLPHEDRDVAEQMRQILEEDGIAVHLESEAGNVRPVDGAVELNLKDRADGTVRGTHLLVATGRRPNTDDLDLEAAGVDVDERGYISVDDRLHTTAEGVYASGDVTGGPAFTHISYDDYRVLKTNLLEGGDRTISERIVSYTVFTDPQLGRVGLTERQAREQGVPVAVATLPMSSVARALETGETRGMMKALVEERSQQIIGAAVLGSQGGEIASIIQVAMLGRTPYTVLRDAAFSHPTLAESLNNLLAEIEA